MSGIRRFLRRWGGYLVFVIVFSIACGLLSWWQFARREEAVAEIDRVAVNYDAEPVAVDEALPALDSWAIDDEWRPVELSGRYLSDQQLLVRNRPRDQTPGFEVLVPLRLDDGRVFVVDRGWIGLGDTDDVPDDIPAAPEGEVTVLVHLKEGEPTLPGRSAPEGQIPTIHLPSVAELVDAPTFTGAYGLMAAEDPGTATRPLAVAKPVPDEGPHLSYAFQWIAFGILAFIGLGWAVRQDLRVRRAAAAGVELPVRVRARPTDSEEEDALLDAAR